MANKMFVHYSKTKAEFMAAGLATTYNNSIVFIKGDANGDGSCIYTHGQYFANFKEFISAYMAALNYVKGVNIKGTNYNAAAGGGYVAFAASDPSTVEVNADNNGITIGLTPEFINTVNNTATLAGSTSTALGTKDDEANENGSAFARIANLASLVSELTGGETTSIAGQITAAVNDLRAEITGTMDDADSKTLAAINDELDSILGLLNGVTVNGKKIVDKGAAQAVVLAGIDINVGGSSAISGNTVEATLTNHEGRVKANEDAIALLNGNDAAEGSVDKKIKDAINTFATNVSNDGTINTLKELIDYVAGVDGSATLATAIAQIAENKGKIDTLNGTDNTNGSVAKQVKDAIDAEVLRANGAYDATGAAAAVKTYADETFEKIGVAANLIKGLNATIEGTGTNGIKVTVTETEGKITAVAVDDAAVKTAETNAKSYADTLFAWEEL